MASNIAVTSIFLPLVGLTAVAVDQNPLLMMVPCTVAASYAFMLPVATPPNAIVFSSRMITVRDMASTGLLLNILGCVVCTIAMFTTIHNDIMRRMQLIGLPVFHITVGEKPEWA